MSRTALYTFGLLDPSMEPGRLTDFVRRGGEIVAATERTPGFLGRPVKVGPGSESHTPGEDYGAWGAYALPDLPAFAGHDRRVHIATLSLWRDVGSARAFVYAGLHRDALRHRQDWFLKGSWPGYVLWDVEDAAVPRWTEGVAAYEGLARGDASAGYSFTPGGHGAGRG